MLKRMTIGSALLGALALAAPVHAADNTMAMCGTKYQAAKAAKTLPAGQTWNQFLALCRAGKLPGQAYAAPAAKPVPMTVTRPAPAPRPAGQQSSAMVAMHAREKQCGQQWTAAKAAGKIPAGQKWPQYWSQCNARLKS